jgi:hypothetical protein
MREEPVNRGVPDGLEYVTDFDRSARLRKDQCGTVRCVAGGKDPKKLEEKEREWRFLDSETATFSWLSNKR